VGGYIESSTNALEVALDVDETILEGVEFALTEEGRFDESAADFHPRGP